MKCPTCKGSGVEVSAVDYPMGSFECFDCKYQHQYKRNPEHWKWDKQSGRWIRK